VRQSHILKVDLGHNVPSLIRASTKKLEHIEGCAGHDVFNSRRIRRGGQPKLPSGSRVDPTYDARFVAEYAVQPRGNGTVQMHRVRIESSDGACNLAFLASYSSQQEISESSRQHRPLVWNNGDVATAQTSRECSFIQMMPLFDVYGHVDLVEKLR